MAVNGPLAELLKEAAPTALDQQELKGLSEEVLQSRLEESEELLRLVEDFVRRHRTACENLNEERERRARVAAAEKRRREEEEEAAARMVLLEWSVSVRGPAGHLCSVALPADASLEMLRGAVREELGIHPEGTRLRFFYGLEELSSDAALEAVLQEGGPADLLLIREKEEVKPRQEEEEEDLHELLRRHEVLRRLLRRRFADEEVGPQIVILGPTGCGKSTLINSMMGHNFMLNRREDDRSRATQLTSKPIHLIDTPGLGDVPGFGDVPGRAAAPLLSVDVDQRREADHLAQKMSRRARAELERAELRRTELRCYRSGGGRPRDAVRRAPRRGFERKR